MRSTKKSLIASGISLAVSMALMVGSTFAWFTDSVVNKGNTIQAGSLEAAFQYKPLTDEDAVYADVPETAQEGGALFTEQQWEPGYAFGYDFKVSNKGSLAFDWQMSFENMTSTGGSNGADIADVLDVYILAVDAVNLEGAAPVGTLAYVRDNLSNIVKSGRLEAADSGAESAEEFSVVLKMKEEAGNDYQGAAVNFDLYLKAKQATVEEDGFGSIDYDKDALYPSFPAMIDTTIEKTISNSAAATTLTDSAAGVSATIPANTLSNGDKVVLTVERTDVSTDSVTYDIDLLVNGETPDEPLANPITVKLNIGAGLKNVKVKHNGVSLTEADTGADQTYSYNANTGILTIVTASFSPFEVSYTMPAPVVSIGDTGYASLSSAISAAKAGDTITLLNDIVIDEAVSYSDPWGDPGKAGIPKLRNITIDGADHTITAPENNYLFGDIRNSVIKNATIELRGASAVYFTWNVVFENVITTGRAAFNGGNEGAFVIYAYDGELTFKNCTNKATLTAGGAWGNYNAVFVGYPLQATNVITFDGCVNEGSLVCGTAAMFIANPHYTAFTLNINNCANNGQIQATYIADSTYRPNLITAVTNDGTNTLLTVNAGEKTYKGVTGEKSIYNVPVGGNPIVNGPQDSTLAINLNDDGSFTVTPASTAGVDYYMVSYGVYSTLVAGGSQQHAMLERLEADGSLVTEMKNLEFVDQKWVDSHSDAVSSKWNGYTVYTLGSDSYYLLPDADLSLVTLNGNPKPGSQCAVSAYSADGKLLASAQLRF